MRPPCAAVCDGHGGALSAQWLYDELFDAIRPLVTAQLLDTEEQQGPSDSRGGCAGGGTPAARELLAAARWPAKAARALSECFRQTDARLIDFLRSEWRRRRVGD